jgi:hypothetical protein
MTPLRLLILVVFAACCAAQIPDAELTKGFMNGRYWATLPFAQKLAFVVGMRQARYWVAADAYDCEISTCGEMTIGIGAFYSEPSNGIIPVTNALNQFR